MVRKVKKRISLFITERQVTLTRHKVTPVPDPHVSPLGTRGPGGQDGEVVPDTIKRPVEEGVSVQGLPDDNTKGKG